MRRYLHSSVEALDRIDALLDRAGISSVFASAQLVEVAERANVPILPLLAPVNDWLRGLNAAQANAVIEQLQCREAKTA